MYGVSTTAPLRFKHVASNTFGSMFYIEDEELDLDDVINAPLPKVPLDVCFTSMFFTIHSMQFTER
jgi:transcription initiation factor TFIID subunit 6